MVSLEAAAKNLVSEHIYDLSKPLEARMDLSPGRFTTYGKKYKIDAENWAQLDRETGIIKPGPIVKKGDVLATSDHRKETDQEDRNTSPWRFEFSRNNSHFFIWYIKITIYQMKISVGLYLIPLP